MPNDWDIKSRGDKCSVTGKEFSEGENFYTLLFHVRDGFRREDLSEEAWQQRNDNIQPFSFWRSKFDPPPAAPVETLPKETAEDLLRRYMQENDATHANARYILALMLERKRLLKEIEVNQSASGKTRIYEHVKTGEVFVIPDPELRLDQIEAVQTEVASLLG